MIFIDNRTGSAEVKPYLSRLGVECDLISMDAGDFAFTGNGPDGEVAVGYERKRLNDLIQSMRDERLAGSQLKKMIDSYNYPNVIVEGVWRPDQQGSIEVLIGKNWSRTYGKSVTYRQVQAFLNSLTVTAGVRIVRSGGPLETAYMLCADYHWWQKEWDSHTTMRRIYKPALESKRVEGMESRVGFGRGTNSGRRDPGLLEEVASTLPGIAQKAWGVGEVFDTVEDMVGGSVRDWMKVDGVGKKGAEEIWRALRTKGYRKRGDT